LRIFCWRAVLARAGATLGIPTTSAVGSAMVEPKKRNACAAIRASRAHFRRGQPRRPEPVTDECGATRPGDGKSRSRKRGPVPHEAPERPAARAPAQMLRHERRRRARAIVPCEGAPRVWLVVLFLGHVRCEVLIDVRVELGREPRGVAMLDRVEDVLWADPVDKQGEDEHLVHQARYIEH